MMQDPLFVACMIVTGVGVLFCVVFLLLVRLGNWFSDRI